MEMVRSIWILIYVITTCKYLQIDAKQKKKAEVLKFYDEFNNLHLINLTIPDITEWESIINVKKLDADARFWLYTRKNKLIYEELHKDHFSNNTYFNPINPLVVVTHGWLGSGYVRSAQWTKNAFLETRDVNVIIVDWEKDAKHGYLRSAHATKLVAEQIRDMIIALSKRYKLRGRNMHFIGHSLGAHVVGLAGIKLRRKLIVGYVTGLDPARPFFEFPKLFPAIKKKSAKFVDIIHTNVGVLGYISKIGHVDFYPNGGYIQPHCCLSFNILSCEHYCSYIYFQEAIRGITYMSTKCGSYIAFLSGFCDDNDKQIMGLEKTTARGSYYLTILY